jgi:transposase-like protein
MPRVSSNQKRTLWHKRLQRFAQSKLSVTEFCRREGVSAASFYQWRRKLADSSPDDLAQQSPGRAHFIPVEVAATTGLEVRFPNGVRLTLPASDPELVRLSINTIALARTTVGEM